MLFYLVLSCFCKHDNHGLGWCQTFALFYQYSTYFLDGNRLVLLFFYSKNLERLFAGFFLFILDVQIIMCLKLEYRCFN